MASLLTAEWMSWPHYSQQNGSHSLLTGGREDVMASLLAAERISYPPYSQQREYLILHNRSRVDIRASLLTAEKKILLSQLTAEMIS